MATYHLDPTRENLHGTFSRDIAPVLTIDPGDCVVFRTLDAGWHLEPCDPSKLIGNTRRFEPRRTDGYDDGHCLVGPVAVRGAQPGMTLEIRIDAIEIGTFGWTVASGWAHAVNERLGLADCDHILHCWTLDPDAGTGRNQYGHEVKLRPFLGVMGMPPDEPGWLPTAPPRPSGGNLDCKELVAGTTLYLPITVEGGLFSVGDGHAAQGDGEVCVTAIECPMEQVALTFGLRDDMPITTPHIRTADSWMTLGLHEDLDEAGFRALEAILDLMQYQYGLERRNALALASVVVDLRVTQIVNGVKGVHAILRDDAITVPAKEETT